MWITVWVILIFCGLIGLGLTVDPWLPGALLGTGLVGGGAVAIAKRSGDKAADRPADPG